MKEIQIFSHGQILVFKRENYECICNGESTKLHKIKIVFFLIQHMCCYDAYFFTNYVIIRD